MTLSVPSQEQDGISGSHQLPAGHWMDQDRHRSNTSIPLFHTSSLIDNISAIGCEHTGVKGARGRIMGRSASFGAF
jgi:hypothetical protein